MHRPCAGRTHEPTHPDTSNQTCWDADRLNPGRVGITPDPGRIRTAAARRRETIKWVERRASFGVVPEIVNRGWGIDLEGDR